MAVPRKKVSKSKRDMRRAHQRLPKINAIECSNCGELKLPHHICPSCGFYNGREVLPQVAESAQG